MLEFKIWLPSAALDFTLPAAGGDPQGVGTMGVWAEVV